MREYRYYLLVSFGFAVLTAFFSKPEVGIAKTLLVFWVLGFSALAIAGYRNKLIENPQMVEVEDLGPATDSEMLEGARRSSQRLRQRADELRKEHE